MCGIVTPPTAKPSRGARWRAVSALRQQTAVPGPVPKGIGRTVTKRAGSPLAVGGGPAGRVTCRPAVRHHARCRNNSKESRGAAGPRTMSSRNTYRTAARRTPAAGAARSPSGRKLADRCCPWKDFLPPRPRPSIRPAAAWPPCSHVSPSGRRPALFLSRRTLTRLATRVAGAGRSDLLAERVPRCRHTARHLPPCGLPTVVPEVPK